MPHTTNSPTSSPTPSTTAAWLTQGLKRYEGWTLDTVDVSGPTEDDNTVLVLVSPDQKRLVGLHVLRDPEGNGPGFLEAVEAQL